MASKRIKPTKSVVSGPAPKKYSVTNQQYKCLFEDVKASEEADSGFFQNAANMRRFLAGDQWDTAGKANTDAQIVVNLVHSVLRSMLPTIFFREPRVRCYPAHPNADGKERAWENALNFVVRKNGFKNEFKAAIFDALLVGEGWLKHSFVVPAVKNTTKPEGEQRTNRTATSESRRGDGPWNTQLLPIALRVSASNVIVDYLAPERDPAQARFVAVKYYRLYDELISDTERYPDAKNMRVDKTQFVDVFTGVTNSRAKQENKSGRLSSQQSEKNMVVLYEIYVERYIDVDDGVDIQRRMIVLADGFEGALRDEPWANIVGPDFSGFPVKRFVFNRVPDDYPMAEAEAWLSLQTSLNWLMSRITTFVTNQNRKIGVVPNRLLNPKKAIKQLGSRRDTEIIELKEAEDNAKEPWFVLQNANVPSDMYQLLTIVVQFIERVSQIGRNKQGNQANYRTATEAGLVDQASRNRDDERVDIITDYMLSIIQGFAAVLAQHADSTFIFTIAGDTGRNHWGNFTSEELEYMPDIEIEASSFRLTDVREEAMKYQQILNVFAQFMPVLGPIVKIGPLVRKWLEALRIPNPDDILENMEGNREYQLLEVFMMMSGQAVTPKPEEPHSEHIEALDFLMASPVWNMLPPETRLLVMQHYDMHRQFMVQMAEMAQNAGASTLDQNPLDNSGDISLANSQRTQAAYEREAAGSSGGSAGPFDSEGM